MIMDGLLLFSTAQALTTTAASTNIINLTNARDLGIGNDWPAVKVMVQIGTSFAGGTSITFQFQGSTDNSTWTTYVESAAILTAALVAGSAHYFPIDIPARTNGVALPLYYRLNYSISGTMSAGALTAGLVLDRQANHSYAAGLTVAN